MVFNGNIWIHLDRDSFLNIVNTLRDRGLVIIHGIAGTIKKKHVYIATYHSLVFVYESEEPIRVPVDIEARTLAY